MPAITLTHKKPSHIQMSKKISNITLVKSDRDSGNNSQETPVVLLSNLPDAVAQTDIKNILHDEADNIKGVKRLASGCFMVFVTNKDIACSISGKYAGAEIEGQRIFCYPMLKLLTERKFEVKLRK